MAKFDVKKMAAGLKLSSEKDPGDGSETKSQEGAEESLGKQLCEAVAAKNYAAIEEAVRAIRG